MEKRYTDISLKYIKSLITSLRKMQIETTLKYYFLSIRIRLQNLNNIFCIQEYKKQVPKYC